ncbi:type II toxin-antitoxin system ParD family antitoxin [Microbacterium sp. BH-3-3-3]|uniref:type II toxin-antitoxin system ParD family antitoxin n=1 Tax=Microbacterium sp. BH-3-3-3 TaxID=1906742 RepID=UPI0011A97871|nr:type II toxin-antitoxin system ParD family antitoxin [Microbacterium sp. BH-3-3-3]
MATMNISLPDELRAFADEQVSSHLYSSSSEYVRELIRRDRDNARLREAVLDGIRSGGGSEMDAAYFDRLRARATEAR